MAETTTFKSPSSPVNNSADPAQPEVPASPTEQTPVVNGTPAEESMPTTEIIVTDKDAPPTPKDSEDNKNAANEEVASEPKNESEEKIREAEMKDAKMKELNALRQFLN